MYDCVIIGGGPGGYTAALEAAGRGMRAALVEKDAMGGTCLQRGCIPTKCLAHDAGIVHAAKHAPFLKGAGALAADMGEIISRKRQVVSRLTQGVEGLLAAAGVPLVRGEALLETSGEVTVGSPGHTAAVLRTREILIASGSRPAIIPALAVLLEKHPGLVQTTDAALDDPVLPDSMLIVGGGVIGVEMAAVFAKLGTTVTLVEMLPDIMMTEDTAVRTVTREGLQALGVAVHVGTALESAFVVGTDLGVQLRGPDGQRFELFCSRILCAVGRQAVIPRGSNARNLACRGGCILTDSSGRTNLPHVYALGDVTGGMQLAHRAAAQGAALAACLAGEKPETNLALVPRCIWGPLEIGAVGLNEDEARQVCPTVRVGMFPLTASGAALVKGEGRGFIKILAVPESGKILGVHMAGPSATDLIAEAVTVMTMEGVVEDLYAGIKPHPTMSEAVAEAAMSVNNRAIHLPRRP